MPEGPECTIQANSLNRLAAGKQITDIKVVSGRYLTKPIVNLDKILNSTITRVSNKGKFIFWEFENGFYLFSTLGMSGIYSETKTPHSRVEFLLDKIELICYNDVRQFGTLKIASKFDLDKKLSELGPDMLNDPCSYSEFEKILKKNEKWILGPFLLEQKKLSGIGNIYKSECCYLAAIDPSRNLSSLSDEEKSRLYHSILEILSKAYQYGGSSQKDFTDVDGKPGSFLKDYANVYRRTTDRNGNSVVSVALGDDRTTWWCPSIQK